MEYDFSINVVHDLNYSSASLVFFVLMTKNKCISKPQLHLSSFFVCNYLKLMLNNVCSMVLGLYFYTWLSVLENIL